MTPSELKARREGLHLTQRQCAERLGYSYGGYQKLEQGARLSARVSQYLETMLARLEAAAYRQDA